MSNDHDKNHDNKDIKSNMLDLLKKVSIQIQVDLNDQKNENQLKLPYLVQRKNSKHIINRNNRNLRRKLAQIGDFCQYIYTNSIPSTLNITKNMEDALDDAKLKTIEEIKKDYFVNQYQSINKEDNNCNNNSKDNINSNKQFYKKIIVNKSKPQSLKKIIKNNICV